MKLRDAIDRFTEHLQANGCWEQTIRSHRCDLEGLLRFYAGRLIRLSAITPDSVARLLNSPYALFGPTGIERGPGARGRLHSVLRSFFGWAGSPDGRGSADGPVASRALRPRAIPASPPMPNNSRGACRFGCLRCYLLPPELGGITSFFGSPAFLASGRVLWASLLKVVISSFTSSLGSTTM